MTKSVPVNGAYAISGNCDCTQAFQISMLNHGLTVPIVYWKSKSNLSVGECRHDPSALNSVKVVEMLVHGCIHFVAGYC